MYNIEIIEIPATSILGDLIDMEALKPSVNINILIIQSLKTSKTLLSESLFLNNCKCSTGSIFIFHKIYSVPFLQVSASEFLTFVYIHHNEHNQLFFHFHNLNK